MVSESITFPHFFIKEVNLYGYDPSDPPNPIIPIEGFCKGGSIAGFDEIFEKFKTAYCASNGNITEKLNHSHDVEDVRYGDGYCVGIEIVKDNRYENCFVANCICVSHEGGPADRKCFVLATDKTILENEK
jgi:hypothetical protein